MIPRKVCIVGLGLIGGSLGMALVQKGEVPTVTGWDLSPDARREAHRLHAVHQVSETLESAVLGADFVVIATPIRSVVPTLKQLLPYLHSEVVITDVASTKGELAWAIDELIPAGIQYLGGHPMAGTEKTGVSAADPYLFENAVYILTPSKSTSERAMAMAKEVLRMIGAHPLVLSPEDHDRMVAVVSHIPHLVAVSLAKMAGEVDKELPGTLSLAAGGFRDTTRIAMSPPALWGEIAFSNRALILELLTRYEQELSKFRNALAEGREMDFREAFRMGGEVRRQVPQKNKGYANLLHEFVVQVEDKPGSIRGVVNLLADMMINIKDIEILRVREGVGGTLRLAVEDEPSMTNAIRVLVDAGYRVFYH